MIIKSGQPGYTYMLFPVVYGCKKCRTKRNVENRESDRNDFNRRKLKSASASEHNKLGLNKVFHFSWT